MKCGWHALSAGEFTYTLTVFFILFLKTRHLNRDIKHDLCQLSISFSCSIVSPINVNSTEAVTQ